MDNQNHLTKEEAIRRITEVYHSGYSLDDPDFDIYDQLLACEAVAEAQEEQRKNGEYFSKEHNKPEDNVDAFVDDNNTYKRKVNFELTESKLQIIKELQECTYRTLPIEVSKLLEEFFFDPNTKPNHWLNIAQMYPPKRIYQTIAQMIKRQSGGWISIETPAAYFTFLIKFRAKRKSLKPPIVSVNS